MAMNESVVTFELAMILLSAIEKSLNMLPPLERTKFPELLLKIYGKNCAKKTLSFIGLLSALIECKTDGNTDCFEKRINEDATPECVDRIVEYVTRRVFWFNLEKKGKQSTKSVLNDSKRKLGETGTTSKGKKSSAKALFTVRFELPTSMADTKKRKRGDDLKSSILGTRYRTVLIYT
jgi:hypothetical protein